MKFVESSSSVMGTQVNYNHINSSFDWLIDNGYFLNKLSLTQLEYLTTIQVYNVNEINKLLTNIN